MLKNHFKISLRNLWKQKGFTFINLLGMAIGMACCFLLFIYVHHETHFDRHHPDVDNLYRMNYHATFGGNEVIIDAIPAPIAPLMKQDLPQVEHIARMYPRGISIREVGAEQSFELPNALFADSTVQAVFGFRFLEGNPDQALLKPFSIVLTKETADKLFGNRDAMNQQVLLAGKGPFTVTGVLENIPPASHLSIDLLVPYRNMADVEEDYMRPAMEYVTTQNFMASHSRTYLRLKPGTDPAEIDQAMIAFMERYGHKEMIKNQRFRAFPVKDIHLAQVPGQTSPVTFLRFFLSIGVLILLIACINFINLSTATYLNRTKEVGVRKVLGASRLGLTGQFMGETLLVSFLAFLMAMVAIDWLLPYLSGLVDRRLSFGLLENWPLTLTFVGIFLGAGLLAGTYPALVASRFKPVDIFRDKVGQSGGVSSGWLRKSLITVQFAVGILLVCGTLIILSQINHLRNLPLGFHSDHIVAVPLQSQNMNSLFAPGDSTMRARMNAFEEKILQNPNVEASTLGSALPGLGRVYHPVVTDKVTINDNVVIPAVSVDYDYAETFGLEIVAGRDFGKEHGTDHLTGFIINELAVKQLKWETPEEALGQNIGYGSKKGQVVGVVKDYATSGMQLALEPLVMDVRPGVFSTFAIRLKNQDLPNTLDFLRKTWATFFPTKAFEYRFLDDSLADAYQNENRLASLVTNFSAIAIFLSCFGLFGLISLTVKQRAKEIGIRKVLGASVTGIIGLLSKDFLKLVLIALLLAAPASWYLMNKWLADFANRIEIQWWHFAVAGALAVLIAFLTMSLQSTKAALANPVSSLKNE